MEANLDLIPTLLTQKGQQNRATGTSSRFSTASASASFLSPSSSSFIFSHTKKSNLFSIIPLNGWNLIHLFIFGRRSRRSRVQLCPGTVGHFVVVTGERRVAVRVDPRTLLPRKSLVSWPFCGLWFVALALLRCCSWRRRGLRVVPREGRASAQRLRLVRPRVEVEAGADQLPAFPPLYHDAQSGFDERPPQYGDLGIVS